MHTGYEWVGWRNDSLGLAGKPVEMTFEFETVRNFSAIVLHTNNMYSKDVAVSEASIIYFIVQLFSFFFFFWLIISGVSKWCAMREMDLF